MPSGLIRKHIRESVTHRVFSRSAHGVSGFAHPEPLAWTYQHSMRRWGSRREGGAVPAPARSHLAGR